MKSTAFPLLLALIVCACGGRESDTSEPADTTASAAPDTTASAARCLSPGDEMTGSGIGQLQIGMPADELVRQCDVATDTTVMDIEGYPQRVALVASGSDTVRVEIVDDRVWRITVETPAWRTSDSLGVGSPISDLLALPEAQGFTGEGNLVVVSPRHCGLSFQVEAGDVQPPPADAWDAEALGRIPDTAAVELVRITGCPDENP